MKEREIEKMVELEGKMKLIMDKLSADKKVYVAENSRMAEELMEIKNLFSQALGQEGYDDDLDEEDEDEEDEEGAEQEEEKAEAAAGSN